ncbi:hypothetical protein BU26DRAFT_519442 [Trematosphaeria pertusa]|uniref:Gfd2/YDR514C-like C-terminal domain-containing protein n=1 Tax=Trematosphaeria pertusa TaxID=390896 RepID=A0A6A6IIE9_9PLEO|nr:uncharacterized protein BU26DRAFT_519442 [Trematosphaeria pertusa]KAF2249333.1 hypothetical protein BU26DRAFT_519442 [Trematosphaeria pertusa]
MHTSTTHHIRLVETCHKRNKKFAPGVNDAEKNSLYAHTRFLSVAAAKEKMLELLADQRCPHGSKAPVLILGHGLNQDMGKLKAQWGLRLNGIESVVHIFASVAKLAR